MWTSEWWTYGLRDLLLFSARTYYRLTELYNLELWPLQLLAGALGAALWLLWRRGGAASGRFVALLLALCWLWVAWAYHWQRYASINWAASYFALAWAAQAVLLLGAAARGDLAAAPLGRLPARFAQALLLYALLLHPLLAPLLGRGWAQAELFGLLPDPTALATLAVLLRASPRRAIWLWPLPLLWCLISGATRWAMASPDWLIVPLAALLAAGCAIGGARLRKGGAWPGC